METKSRKRKSKKKKLLIVILILLALLIAAAAIFFLVGANSENKKQYEAKIEKQTREMTEELLGQIDSIDTDSIEADGELTGGNLPREEQQFIDQQLTKIKDARKQAVLQALAENYSSIMHQQKDLAMGMLNDLIAQGKADWEAQVAAGKAGAAEKGKLASEYLAMVDTMERKVDESFAAVVAKMEKQLKDEGIEAAPIIDKYKADYKSIKAENRKAMMDKAMNALGI